MDDGTYLRSSLGVTRFETDVGSSEVIDKSDQEKRNRLCTHLHRSYNTPCPMRFTGMLDSKKFSTEKKNIPSSYQNEKNKETDTQVRYGWSPFVVYPPPLPFLSRVP